MVVASPGRKLHVAIEVFECIEDFQLLFIRAYAVLVSMKGPDGNVLNFLRIDKFLCSLQSAAG